MGIKTCELCLRELDSKTIQFHHLIPKKLHGKKHFIKKYGKEYMRTHGINICNACHKQIHKLFPHKTLGLHYNSLELLLNSEQIQKWLRFIRKH